MRKENTATRTHRQHPKNKWKAIVVGFVEHVEVEACGDTGEPTGRIHTMKEREREREREREMRRRLNKILYLRQDPPPPPEAILVIFGRRALIFFV